MKDGIQLNYGQIRGNHNGFPIDITDGAAFYWQSGKFLFRNITSGYGEVADTSDKIIGHAEVWEIASSSSLRVWCVNDLTAVFRIPLIYDGSTYGINYSDAILGEVCDFKVSGGKQYANPATVSGKALLIVGGKAATGTDIVSNDGYLDVQINPSALNNLAVGG